MNCPRIVRPKNLTIERGSFFVVKYSFKFKLYAVKLYLSTEGSYQELAKLEFLLLRYYGYRSLNINNNFKESAFSGTVFAHQGDAVVRVDYKRNVGEKGSSRELYCNIIDRNH